MSASRSTRLGPVEVLTGDGLKARDALAGSPSREGVGRVFTPLAIARLMASWVAIPNAEEIRILDPGAGEGILSIELVRRLASLRPSLRLFVEAYEVDLRLAEITHQALTRVAKDLASGGTLLEFRVRPTDYLAEWATSERRLDDVPERFDLVIQNPPYSKVRRDSAPAIRAGALVHGQPNLYGLFLAKAAHQIRRGGQMVAIAPRSWWSGSYFLRMRTDFLGGMAIERVHSFQRRGEAFGRDSVLQETVIFLARKTSSGPKPLVNLSLSQGLSDLDNPTTFTFPWTFLCPRGVRYPIRLPESLFQIGALRELDRYSQTLNSLGLRVFTGPVVGFRARRDTAWSSERNAELAPLVWLEDIRPDELEWSGDPKARHPPYIKKHAGTSRLLVRGEDMVLVRRFSAKEDLHRVIACYVSAGSLGPTLGVENKVNVIQGFRGPDAPSLARAVSTYLNSELVDQYVRAVAGTTQVNACDLAQLPFPPRSRLLELAS